MRLCVILFSFAGFAFTCENASADWVKLTSGETLNGQIKSQSDDMIVFVHPVLGELSILHTGISSAGVDEPPAAEASPPAPLPAAPTPPPRSVWEALIERDDTPFSRGWEFAAEAGINGTSGNTEEVNARFVAQARRSSKKMDTAASAEYTGTKASGDTTRSRADINFRNDWKLGESPWRVFAKVRTEYDQFQDWDWRASAYSGVGYQLLKSDSTEASVRVGLGGSQLFGSSNDRFVPEANFGFDLTRKITARSSVYVNSDWYPSLLDIDEFRSVIRGGYRLDVDPDSKMYLKLGMEWRHDNAPGPDASSDDTDYFALLGWTF